MYENSKLPFPDHSQTKNGHVTQEIETNRIKLKTGFCLWIIPINALWISLTFFSKERWYNYLYHGIFFSIQFWLLLFLSQEIWKSYYDSKLLSHTTSLTIGDLRLFKDTFSFR